MDTEKGKIIRGVGGFYYVCCDGIGILECRAKGLFRKLGIKPLVGDNVTVQVISYEDKTGNIEEILQRSSSLVRPAVANVDQVLVLFAAAQPDPNLNLLDRFLMTMDRQDIPTVICFNKADIVSGSEIRLLADTYKNSGYPVYFISIRDNEGLDEVRELLQHKTTVLAGPSGVGKSSFLNCMLGSERMETGDISQKIRRGRNTTRHSEIFPVNEDTFICDTPGFSSLYIDSFEKEEIRDHFQEFREYEPRCRFKGCMHISEPDCAVKEALARGEISRIRYDNYCQLVSECSQQKKY